MTQPFDTYDTPFDRHNAPFDWFDRFGGAADGRTGQQCGCANWMAPAYCGACGTHYCQVCSTCCCRSAWAERWPSYRGEADGAARSPWGEVLS